MTMWALMNMALHVQVNITPHQRVMRVCGGWIYSFHDVNGWCLSSSFVPELVHPPHQGEKIQ